MAEQQSKQKREIVKYAPYWRLPNGAVFEAITISGKPYFLVYERGKFTFCPEIAIHEDDKTIELVRPVEDFPYSAYEFTVAEIDALPSRAANDAIEKAFEAILNTITPYQDTDTWHLQIDAAGILLSYFQNKVKTVPYIAKIGAPESGKTRSNYLVAWLAYRPMMAVNMTPANIYRFYGKDLQAVGTIIHDEIDDGEIDRDKAMLSIYNAGYKYGAKVPRIGDELQERQDYYNCFGIKWFSGTELPYSKTFRSRCIIQNFMQGVPQKIDITDEDEELFKKVRKGLLVLRLLKAHESFEQVNTGLIGRSRELYTPLLAVVQGTKYYNILLSKLMDLDKERHEEDKESREAYVARAVIACYLDAVLKKSGKNDVSKLTANDIAEPVFVANENVITKMSLTEIADSNNKKILVNDEIPHTYTATKIGLIQAQNLKGTPTRKWNDDNTKLLRGYVYNSQTISRLNARYGTGKFVTLEPLVTLSGGEGSKKTPQNEPLLPKRSPNNGVFFGDCAVISVTSGTGVTDGSDDSTTSTTSTSLGQEHGQKTPQNKPLFVKKGSNQGVFLDGSKPKPVELVELVETPASEQNASNSNPTKAENQPAKTESSTDADSKTAKTNVIKCPICDSKFSTVKLVVQHSINRHPRQPIVAMLQELGYNVDDV